MIITVDTNVLIRAVVQDEPVQAKLAADVLLDVTVIAVTMPCLCEFVWVLRKVYGVRTADVALAIRALISAENVETNRPAVDAGLAMLEAGGDFADGVIAFEGRCLGGDTFISFDEKAVVLLLAQGHAARR